MGDPFSGLPNEIGEEVRDAFFPFTWDQLSPEQRKSVAAQVDYNSDPSTEAERTAAWELSVKATDLEIELERVELMAAIVPTEYQAKRSLLSQIKSELKAAREQFDQLFPETTDSEQDAPAQAVSKEFSQHQSNAAKKRHKENYQLREAALQHYQDNKAEYTSMTDAATRIAGKVVPMPMRTVYDWIRDWERMRSAG